MKMVYNIKKEIKNKNTTLKQMLEKIKEISNINKNIVVGIENK